MQKDLGILKHGPFLGIVDKREKKISYGKNWVQIHHDDCINFLHSVPSESVDLVITDPAYSGMNNKLKLGKGRIVGTYGEKGVGDARWFSEFQDTEENYEVFLSECKRILKKKMGHIYIMFDSFSLLSLAPIVRKHFDVKNILVWDKVNMGMGHYFRRRHEFILFATNGNNQNIKNRSFPDVWKVKRIHNAKYPTQKPVEIFDIMLDASAQKNYTICDPFLGSGSSAIATIKAGCNFIGSDISEKAIKMSIDRVQTYIDSGLDPLQKQSSSINFAGN